MGNTGGKTSKVSFLRAGAQQNHWQFLTRKSYQNGVVWGDTSGGGLQEGVGGE